MSDHRPRTEGAICRARVDLYDESIFSQDKNVMKRTLLNNISIGIIKAASIRRLDWAKGTLKHLSSLRFEEVKKTWMQDVLDHWRKFGDNLGQKSFGGMLIETQAYSSSVGCLSGQV
jgi:hypothetical protein